MIRFFKQMRLKHIEVKLAGAEAALDNERAMIRASGEMYPIVLSRLVREVAELKARVAQLKGTPK